MAVPILVKRRHAVVPAVITKATPSEITCVQLTTAPNSVKRWFVARQDQDADERASGRRTPGHDPEQDQRQPERAHHLHEGVARGEERPEDHAVQEVDHAAEEDASEVGEPVRQTVWLIM